MHWQQEFLQQIKGFSIISLIVYRVPPKHQMWTCYIVYSNVSLHKIGTLKYYPIIKMATTDMFFLRYVWNWEM